MKKLLSVLILSLSLNLAYAAPASVESIEELLILTKSEAMVDSLYANMDQLMRSAMTQAIDRKTLTPSQQKAFDQLPGKFVAVVKEELSWAKMKPQYVRIYRETFDQEEIDGLIAFYRSPTGQAFIGKMPVVMQKSLALSNEQLKTLMPRMAGMIQEVIQEAESGK